MTNHSGYLAAEPLTWNTGDANTRLVINVPVEQIVIESKRRVINEENVAVLMESISITGLIYPIIVAKTKAPDGDEKLRLSSGYHRLLAAKRLGISTIQCMVLEVEDARRRELAEIEDNLTRRDLSAVEHALLTARRREIILELAAQDGTLSQDETASRQAKRRAGQKTGHDVGSVRDQANKTGEGKDKIHRSSKRIETLGAAILESILGTSLDTGVELDALTKLPETVRDDLANRAAGGTTVSARQVLREAKRKAEEEPQHQSRVGGLEQAYGNFCEWMTKYADLFEAKGLMKLIEEFEMALCDAIYHPQETERTGERAKKSKWFKWRKGRKGD